METVALSGGKKKEGKTHLLYYILQGWSSVLPIHNTEIQAASTHGKIQREHTQLRDNKHFWGRAQLTSEQSLGFRPGSHK